MANAQTYEAVMNQIKSGPDFGERADTIKKMEAALEPEKLKELNYRKISTSGGTMNKIEMLEFCIFDMKNDGVKWMGYYKNAPDYVKDGFTEYCKATIGTMNYSLRNFIGSSSEDNARKNYIRRIAEGGEQFLEAVKDELL